jgi:SecD/SecF fusion protein
MNKWTKSILIGVGITLFYFGLAWLIKRKSIPVTYAVHYVIRVTPKETPFLGKGKLIDRTAAVLDKRMTHASFKPKVKAINDQLLDLTLTKVADTSQITRLITGNSHMEFREMYILPDLAASFEKADSLFGFKKVITEKIVVQEEPQADTSSGFVKYSDLDVPPPVEDSQQSVAGLIEFSQPYNNPGGNTSFPASIGRVLIKDTGLLNEELNRREFAISLPVDTKFLYGPSIEYLGIKNEEYLELYVVRVIPGMQAFLDNNDIEWARHDYTQSGEPMLNFEFNPVAAKKWEQMTRNNINKNIAIVVDGQVISAPKVNGAIEGGSAMISGGLSVSEAMELAVQFSAGALPGYTSIEKKEISRERGPIFPANPLLFLLVFLISGGITFLIINLLNNK